MRSTGAYAPVDLIRIERQYMTTILYENGNLHGDTSMLHILAIPEIKLGTKVFVSNDKQFAYAISGGKTPKIYDQLEQILRSILIKVHTADIGHYTDIKSLLDESSVKFLSNMGSDFIIMTTSRCILVGATPYGNDGVVEVGDMASLGTGSEFIIGILEATGDVQMAYAVISKMDRMSNNRIISISREELEPFVMESEDA